MIIKRLLNGFRFVMDSAESSTYLSLMTWDQEIDATGLLCPLPVLKARKRLKAMQSGEILRLVATDPAAVVDVPHFCNEAGHLLVSQAEDGEARIYLIQRG